MKKHIAVLLTCFNRKEKTLACLHKFYAARLPPDTSAEIFLVDDGSTDGTSDAVANQFPNVKIIQGNGSLFWNQGMRLAWKTAADSANFDFYLWLNDDTMIDENALVNLFEDYYEATSVADKGAIIIGSCRMNPDSAIFSYGGRNDNGPVMPNGQLQRCKYINGNLVLVPKNVFEVVGNLAAEFTHSIGDNDYGLRTIQNGFDCFVTRTYVATCPSHDVLEGWCDPALNFSKRWKNFHSPLGINIKEYTIYRKRFWKRNWYVFVGKAYVQMLFPSLYGKMLKRWNNK